MGKVFRNKKVIAAMVALAFALLAVFTQTDLGDDTASAVVNAICSVADCQ